MIIGGVNDSKYLIRTAIRTATFSKGNVAQELRRDSSCATLPFAVLVLRYPLYADAHANMLFSTVRILQGSVKAFATTYFFTI